MKRIHSRWLDAAGITESGLRSAYEDCRVLHQRFGRTYYLATLLLSPAKRPYVNSLYGFARYADEIVDNGAPGQKEAAFHTLCERTTQDLAAGWSSHPICRALLHTMDTWGIPAAHVEAFLHSMLMDLTVTEYTTYRDLQDYMYGSAAVIGLQMVPILEAQHPEAAERASALGEAFQLTNFVRDIAEDLDRGRIYLPLEDLDHFGVSRSDLEQRIVTPQIRELLRFQVRRIRALYDHASGGVPMLAPSSQDCIRTALVLYRGILDEVERADYQVFDRRAQVGTARRASVATAGYLRARRHFRAQVGKAAGPGTAPS